MNFSYDEKLFCRCHYFSFDFSRNAVLVIPAGFEVSVGFDDDEAALQIFSLFIPPLLLTTQYVFHNMIHPSSNMCHRNDLFLPRPLSPSLSNLYLVASSSLIRRTSSEEQ